MDYCHKRTFDLRWTDLDFKDEVKPSSLLALCQEAAGSSADELGFGYDDLKGKGLGFIIIATAGEIFRPIRRTGALTVETWPLPPRHVIFERDYRVKNERGETVAALASRWCLVDLERFGLHSAESLGAVHESCPYNPEKTLAPDWKIPKLGAEGKEAFRMKVGSSQCDHYLHANNTRYADFFLDCFSMEELALPIKSFQISYAKQAKEGDELVLFRGDGAASGVCEARANGELLTQFSVKFFHEGETL